MLDVKITDAGATLKIANARKLTEQAKRAALVLSAELVRKTALEKIAKISNGRLVVRKGSTHWVSKAGDAPNTDTGRLVGSFFRDVQGNKAFVGARTNYAFELEYGSSKKAARPYLRPSLQEKSGEINKIFNRAVKASLPK
jgi:phage gpG-like protein